MGSPSFFSRCESWRRPSQGCHGGAAIQKNTLHPSFVIILFKNSQTSSSQFTDRKPKETSLSLRSVGSREIGCRSTQNPNSSVTYFLSMAPPCFVDKSCPELFIHLHMYAVNIFEHLLYSRDSCPLSARSSRQNNPHLYKISTVYLQKVITAGFVDY